MLAGPDVSAALARFVALIGGTALPPALDLGFANTAMALADFPDASTKSARFSALRSVTASAISFHFGSWVYQPWQTALRVHLEHQQIPDARSCSQRSSRLACARWQT